MSKEHDLASDSDDSDVDYVPDGAEEEAKSEVESEGDVESCGSGDDDENVDNKKNRKGKVNKHKKRTKKRKDDSSVKKAKVEEEEEEVEEKILTEEEEKKRADSLWADFMKDTKTTPRPKVAISTEEKKDEPVKKVEKVTITKVFEFAGEEVRVEKEVVKDSLEARLSSSSDSKANNQRTASDLPATAGRSNGRQGPVRRSGGISSVLGQLGKKSKISTLEKSKLDWESFKKQEDLEEEISTHNRGKDGYLEKQDFLQRTDLRQFEIEKQLRKTSRR